MWCVSGTGPAFFLARALFELGRGEEGVLAGDHLAGAKAVQNLGCLAGALAQLDGAHPKAPWRADEHHVSSTHRLHRLRRDRHPFAIVACIDNPGADTLARSAEHTSELQSLMRTSYAVFCLTNKKPAKDSS